MTDSILFQPRSKDEWANDLINLYPEGSAWNAKYDVNSIIYKMSYSWISGLYDVDKSLCFLIDDANPSLTQNSIVLQFYQNLLGLPDRCVSTDSSFEQQQNQVVARFGLTAGVTSTYYKNFAETYGLSTDVIEYTAALCGLAECGEDSSCVGTEDENTEFCISLIVNGDYSILSCEMDLIELAGINYYFVQKG
jgi:uncharacterized protein YmfQ (DUF2313 family)